MIQSQVEALELADDPVSLELDKEINILQSQILILKTKRSLQASTILSSQSTLSKLNRLCDQKETSNTSKHIDSYLLTTAKAQHEHNQTNLYRICATITSFTIQDPDPKAVNQGFILGLRFDVSDNGQFIRPYYVMLNKPHNEERNITLSVYHHTLPPAIPIATLIENYLPSSVNNISVTSETKRETPKKSLLCFSRALRRSIVAYHNRLSIIKKLRRDYGLDRNDGREIIYKEGILLDISTTDCELRNIRLEWADGRIGRVTVNEDGEILKCTVISEDGRHRATERILHGGMQNLGDNLWQEYCRRIRSISTPDNLD